MIATKMINNIIEWIKHLFTKDKIPEASFNKITFQETINLLKNYCKQENIFLSDNYYYLMPKESAEKWCELSKVKEKKYIAEIQDCDNFSFALHGYWNEILKNYAFGIAWSKTHAFNFMIGNDKQKIYIIEPQTNIWYDIEDIKDIKKYYPFRLVLL